MATCLGVRLPRGGFSRDRSLVRDLSAAERFVAPSWVDAPDFENIFCSSIEMSTAMMAIPPRRHAATDIDSRFGAKRRWRLLWTSRLRKRGSHGWKSTGLQALMMWCHRTISCRHVRQPRSHPPHYRQHLVPLPHPAVLPFLFLSGEASREQAAAPPAFLRPAGNRKDLHSARHL